MKYPFTPELLDSLPEELAELAEYFLIKRILTGTIKHITTHVDNYLHIAGSVSDRNQMEE